jgi:hypothetical protein
MKRKDLSPDLGVDGKIILTVILKKQGVSVCVCVCVCVCAWFRT